MTMKDPHYQEVKSMYQCLKNKPEVLKAIQEQKAKKKFVREQKRCLKRNQIESNKMQAAYEAGEIW